MSQTSTLITVDSGTDNPAIFCTKIKDCTISVPAKIALVDLSISTAIKNVYKPYNAMSISNAITGYQKVVHIPEGRYTLINDLVMAINQSIESISCGSSILFSLTDSGRVHVKISDEKPFQLSFKRLFANMLGFDNLSVSHNDIGNKPINLAFSIPNLIFIYTDTVQESVLSNVAVKLLKIISISQYHKQMLLRSSFPIYHQIGFKQYIPLIHRSNIDSISLELRTIYGELVQFEKNCDKTIATLSLENSATPDFV